MNSISHQEQANSNLNQSYAFEFMNINNPESQKNKEDTHSRAQALQEEIDEEAIRIAKEEYKLEDEILLKGRMSNELI